MAAKKKKTVGFQVETGTKVHVPDWDLTLHLKSDKCTVTCFGESSDDNYGGLSPEDMVALANLILKEYK